MANSRPERSSTPPEWLLGGLIGALVAAGIINLLIGQPGVGLGALTVAVAVTVIFVSARRSQATTALD